MAIAVKLASKSPPPNLRRGNAKVRCGLCKHFDGRGECMKYGYPVRPTQLCDSFAAGGLPSKMRGATS
jgi:hypothetical protein